MYDSIGLIMSNLEKEDMLSFDLHPSWWFGRKMDDSDYEWRFFAEFYGRAMMWYVGHALMGLALNHHLKKVSICISFIRWCTDILVYFITFVDGELLNYVFTCMIAGADYSVNITASGISSQNRMII